MARRSSRIQQVSERKEVRCMWGLFSILESCQGRPSQKMIDYPRKLHTIASFDEECQKIHNGAGGRSVPVGDKDRIVRNCIGADMHIEEHKSKQYLVKRQQYAKVDAQILDRLVKTHKRVSKKSREEAYQSSSSCLNDAAVIMPSTSAEISLNKLTLAAVLGAVCAQNHQEESQLSEYLQRNCDPGKYDQIDKINIQQVQMRAKAFVDQMFIERKFIKEGRNSEPKSFSNSLEVLNSKKGLFMELLPDPNSTLARRFKNLNPSRMETDTVKSILGANIECEGIDAGPSAKSGSALVMHKGNVKDKIVILKPAPPSAKHSGNITCNCSFPNRSDMKTTSFSLRGIKKKLKHTFGVAKREPSQLLCSSDNLSPSAGSECICNGVDVRNSFTSSTNNRKKVQLIKSNRGSDIACVTDTTRRKLDFSSASYSNNQEFDVVLKAKMHLSTRWNDLNSLEAVTSKNSPRTMERILSSPEHDFWPFNPRRDGLYSSGSPEMRFSPYNSSPRVIGCSSQVRPNTEVTSTESEAQDSNTSTSISMKINDESEIAEMNIFLPHESCVSGEVPIETSKAPKCDGSVKHSVQDSLTENKAVTSTLNDSQSTPWNSHNSDTAENIKYQEEHQSPVSVLESFFVEDESSPTITLQNARKQLQPRRLDFEECSVDSFPYYQSGACIEEEEDHLCQYVQSVLEASCLDWDQLSEITCQAEELLHESVFDEVELPPLYCYYEPKLLFDRINEVLLEIYKFRLCFPPYATPKMRSAPLAEVVVNEILGEAEFFLLPTTDRRTLDQLVLKDVANPATWLDLRHDSGHVAAEISEAVLDESLLDTLLELHM